MLRSLQGEGRSDNARFTGLQTTRPPAAAACTSHICGLWVLFLSQLYSLWVFFFKDVYSLTTVQFRCSRVDSQTLEGKSPLHWMADLPHHPFSAVTLIKSALRCLPLLLFSNSSSSAPTPAVILHAFFKLAGNIFYVWYRFATHRTQALFDNVKLWFGVKWACVNMSLVQILVDVLLEPALILPKERIPTISGNPIVSILPIPHRPWQKWNWLKRYTRSWASRRKKVPNGGEYLSRLVSLSSREMLPQ